MTEEDLHRQIAEAVRKVPVRLGPNGKMMVEMGQPIHLNFTEADHLADEVMAVLKSQKLEPGEAAQELAKYIESQPVSVVQEAFRLLDMKLNFELSEEDVDE